MANNGKTVADLSVNNTGLGELGTIRDILMGQHIHQYDTQFVKMQEEFEQMKAQLEEKIEALDKFHKLESMELSKNTNQRLNKLEKQLVQQVERLENKIQTSSTVDKKEMGKLLSNIGRKLMGE